MVDAKRESVTTLSSTFIVDTVVLFVWFIVLQALAIVVLTKKTQS